jgi:hypothetical protein
VGHPVLRVPSPVKSDSSDEITLDKVDPIGQTQVLLYSAPGTGKTILAGTFPPPFRWIDADRGTKSLVWALKDGKLSTQNPQDIVIFQPFEEMNGQYPSRERGITSAFDKISDKIEYWFSPEEVGNWNTIVIDSFTALNEWAINKGLLLNYQYPSSDKPLSRSEATNLKAKVRIVTGEQDYKSAMGLLQGMVDDLRTDCYRNKKNLVIICHEYVETKEDDKGNVKIVKYLPLLIGQLRQRLVKDFDDVWYVKMYQTTSGPRVDVQVHGDSLHVAKTRWGGFLKSEEPADYRTLVEKVRAYHHA